MKELTKEELEEQEKIETQEGIAGSMLVCLFIIQGIALPIVYAKGLFVVGDKLIKASLLVNASYYILKQLFYSGTDTWDAMYYFWKLSIYLVILILLGGLPVTVFINSLDMIGLANYLITVMVPLIITIITLWIIYGVESVQSEIKNECKKLALSGYKQKAYELAESTKYLIGFSIILALIIIGVTFISGYNLPAINWEKPIIYLGTPYCIILAGILLRRD